MSEAFLAEKEGSPRRGGKKTESRPLLEGGEKDFPLPQRARSLFPGEKKASPG